MIRVTRRWTREVFVCTLSMFFVAVPLLSTEALGRDCPSKLPAHLWNVTDSLSLGLELRAFYVGMDVGDGLPVSKSDGGESWDNAFMAGLRFSLLWTPLDELSLTWEGEARYKYPGWENRPVPGLDGRLWQLYVTWAPRPVEVNAGLQVVSFGMASVLDQRFVSADVKADLGPVSLRVFGGATMEWMTRNASNCLWVRYSSATTGWRTLSHGFNNFMGGAALSWDGLRPWSAQAMYLLSWPHEETLRSHAAVLSFRGPIIKKRLSVEIEPSLFVDNTGGFLPAVVGELRFHVPLTAGTSEPLLRLGIATGFDYTQDMRIRPVFENLSWGFLRRYSLYEGHVFSARMDWQIEPWIRPTIGYFYQTFNFSKAETSDELDAGVEFRLGGLYSVLLAYVGLDFSGPHEPSHGLYVEARVILGSEE